MNNPHEDKARAHKVEKLVACIDDMFDSPYGMSAGILFSGMSKWTPACWVDLARMADVNVPSEKTIAAVTVEFQKRIGFTPVQVQPSYIEAE